jgi:hypothetical protein
MWISWLDRNAFSFNHDNWSREKTQALIWEAVVNLGRMAWLRTANLIKQYPHHSRKYLLTFDRVWMHTGFFGARTDMCIQWHLTKPSLGRFR